MSLKDFYIANDMIEDFSEITVHKSDESYDEGAISPLNICDFNYYIGWTVIHFRRDDNNHWHLLIKR